MLLSVGRYDVMTARGAIERMQMKFGWFLEHLTMLFLLQIFYPWMLWDYHHDRESMVWLEKTPSWPIGRYACIQQCAGRYWYK